MQSENYCPILVGDEIKTSGETLMNDADAIEHDKAGRVLILERDGVEDQWPGCCDGSAHGHEAD